MSYEAVLNQIKEAPIECLEEISNIISYVISKYYNESENFNTTTSSAIQEVQEMKNDPSLGKSYTDVDAMMQELLS